MVEHHVMNCPKENDVTNRNILHARIFASFMSSLSMFGALLIIVSYVAMKDIRTRARFILLHLSIGDFGVGLANFLGAVIYFEQYIQKTCCLRIHHNYLRCNDYRALCKTQAFFASFFTIASILWTLILAIYVYILVVDTGRSLSKKLLRFSYLVCWVLPFCVSLWFVLTDRLGSTRIGSGGWCSLRAKNNDGSISVFTVLFGSDLWVLTTFLVILVLYTTTHCYLKIKIKEIRQLYNVHNNQLPGELSSDQKLLLIPLFFIILRIGSVVFSIVFVYTYWWHDLSHVEHMILFFSMAIGDSSQGIVNGFIFCLLTPKVRRKLFFWTKGLCCKKTQQEDNSVLTETFEERSLLGNAMDASYCSSSDSMRQQLKNSSSFSDDD